MPVASGANARLAFKPEAVYGTNPAGSDWLLMPFYPPLSFGAEQSLLENPVIGLGATRDDGDPIFDTVSPSASIEVPLDKVEFGRWAKMLFGAPTTTGAGADKVHTFKSGGATLPSAALELGLADITQYFLMLGAQANTLEINAVPNGRPSVKVGVLGKTVARSSSTVDSALTAPASFEQYLSFGGTLTRNAVALGRVTSLQGTYSNGLEQNRSVGSGENPEDTTAGASTFTGSLGVRVSDGVLFGDAESKAALALALTFTISATKKITFTWPRVFLPRRLAQVQSKGGVQATFEMRAAYDATAGCLMQVEIANQLATYP